MSSSTEYDSRPTRERARKLNYYNALSMTIKRILVGTDFSPEAVVATEHAVKLARYLDAELELVHYGTVPDETRDVPPGSSSAPVINQLALAKLAEDKARLDELRTEIEARGVAVTARLIDAYPDIGLCDSAEELDVGLVVTGTHGRTGLSRFLLGSVAERVMRNCKRPIMVARNSDHDTEGGFKRILVPTDFSQLAERALEFALGLAASAGVVELFHCWQVPPMTMGYELEPLVESLGSEVQAQGDALLETHARDDVHLGFFALRDAPAQGIQVRLEQEDFDCVVMGSHGRRGLSRFLLGSVAEVTVRHAPCSVIVVPNRG